ncbi:unnamed protein product [Schistosoma mattheei]|uniref:Uncharacterized protein n=1 Tax=Schistosoma mattheei TaxID=31246 RepID=A0A183NL47_9TREM|nr:unnamed protein product [Schistosoma mattheei]
MTKKDVKRDKIVAHFLTFLGKEAHSLLKTLAYPEKPISLPHAIFKELLLNHVKCTSFECRERAKCHKMVRRNDPKVGEFILELQKQAAKSHASDHPRPVPSTSVNFGENWPDHPRSCQSAQSIFWLRMFGIYLVSNLVVMVASGSSAQRGFGLRLQRFWSASLRKQSSDSGYKPLWCGMTTGATNTAHRSWYRSPKMTFVGNSTINDRFPVPPILPSYNRSSADQSHDPNHYLWKV